jgi:hypothetical protein
VARDAAASDLDVRLYGGWIDEHGRYTQRAGWLLRGLPSLARRRHGVRLFSHLATCLCCSPRATLLGTFRPIGRSRGQKMVDTMLAIDATHYATSGFPFMVISDDDDLVPALLNARAIGGKVLSVLRYRHSGTGLNDHHCITAGVRFLTLPWENRL